MLQSTPGCHDTRKRMERDTDQNLQGIRVLIAEDNFFLADSLQFALEGLGATVVGPFPTSEQALAALAQGPVDVGILDVDLQGSSSAEVARGLEARGLPFLFMTGFETADLLPAGLRGRPFLHKPVDPYRIAEELLRLLA